MNEPQSRYLLQRIARHVTPDGVAYLDFLDDYSLDKQSADELAVRAATRAADNSSDLPSRLRAAVAANRSRLIEAFEATDYAKIGVVSIDDMRRILKDAASLVLADNQVCCAALCSATVSCTRLEFKRRVGTVCYKVIFAANRWPLCEPRTCCR